LAPHVGFEPTTIGLTAREIWNLTAIRRGSLLVEDFTLGAVDKALEDDGSIANASESAGCDGEIVGDDIEPGELGPVS
jgi:hypothetical protein